MSNRKRSLALAALLMLLFIPRISVASPGVTVNLSQSSGPIGATVTVSGQLENPGAEFKVFWQYIRDWDGRYGFLMSGYAEGFDYVANITVPPAAAGQYYVIVEDEKNHATGYAIFTVTPEISVEPATAMGGAVVTVSGRLINGETVDIRFYDPGDGEETVAQATTDPVTGEFSCRFRAPLKPAGNYGVRAYWNGALQAEAPLNINYEGLFVQPLFAPSGAIVNVFGEVAVNETIIIAFANSTWSVDVATAETDQFGQFSVNVRVPSVSPGDYEFVALNSAGRARMASISFRVLPPPIVVVVSDAANPGECLPGHSAVVLGENFAGPTELVEVYFENVKVAEAVTEADGSFVTEFRVPSDASAGEHAITAIQDPFDISASASITVHTVEIRPYANLYVPGDAVCFRVNSTTPFDDAAPISIRVLDPNKVPFGGVAIDVGDLAQVDGCWVAPYDKATFSHIIPGGAPAGTWTWNATYRLQLYPGAQLSASGVFYVIPRSDLSYIIQRLDEIDVKISSVVYKQDQLYLLVEANQNYVMARLDQLEGNLAGITLDGFARIDTVLGNVSVKLSMLDAQITAVRDNVVKISTSLGTMTSDMATIKNAILKLNGTIVAVENGVAAIRTSVGMITAKIDALNASMVKIGNVAVQLNTTIGTIPVKLDALNVAILNVRDNVVKLNTTMGKVSAKLDDLRAFLEGVNATIVRLTASVEGNIVAVIGAREAEMIARLDALNAAVTSVHNGLATVRSTVGELKADLAALGANVTQLIIDSEGAITVQMRTLLGPVSAKLEDLGGKITAIRENVATVLVPGLGEVKALVIDARSASEWAAQSVSSMNTLMYAVVALSLVAAALSAMGLYLERRKAV